MAFLTRTVADSCKVYLGRNRGFLDMGFHGIRFRAGTLSESAVFAHSAKNVIFWCSYCTVPYTNLGKTGKPAFSDYASHCRIPSRLIPSLAKLTHLLPPLAHLNPARLIPQLSIRSLSPWLLLNSPSFLPVLRVAPSTYQARRRAEVACYAASRGILPGAEFWCHALFGGSPEARAQPFSPVERPSPPAR